jgi:hypothetical protein
MSHASVKNTDAASSRLVVSIPADNVGHCSGSSHAITGGTAWLPRHTAMRSAHVYLASTHLRAISSRRAMIRSAGHRMPNHFDAAARYPSRLE